jgi:hypothetical protein
MIAAEASLPFIQKRMNCAARGFMDPKRLSFTSSTIAWTTLRVAQAIHAPMTIFSLIPSKTPYALLKNY